MSIPDSISQITITLPYLHPSCRYYGLQGRSEIAVELKRTLLLSVCYTIHFLDRFGITTPIPYNLFKIPVCLYSALGGFLTDLQ